MEAGVMGLIVTIREIMNKVVLGFIIIAGIFLSSCEVLIRESKWEQNKELWQVYNSSEEPITWSASMIAEPSISFGFGSSLTPKDVPWVLTGEISNGYFYIEFPDDLELWGADEDSVKVARVYIEKENNSCSRLELHKIGGKYEPGIDMFYLVGDTSYTDRDGNIYNLKSGWNFIDEENGEVYYDVYDLLEMGYRWQFDILNCG